VDHILLQHKGHHANQCLDKRFDRADGQGNIGLCNAGTVKKIRMINLQDINQWGKQE
jgi:hypothetical protein